MLLDAISMPEIILILVIALVVFGPNKLPELGKSLGSAIREFKKESANLTAEVTRAINDEPALKPAAPTAPTAPAAAPVSADSSKPQMP